MMFSGAWFVAWLIDAILTSVVAVIVGFLLGLVLGLVMGMLGSDMGTIEMTAQIMGWIVGMSLSWLYFTLFEASAKQATLGKMALGIIVTDMNGKRISFARANGRYWSKFISAIILLIGYIMAAFTKRKQALHDMIADTLVVRK